MESTISFSSPTFSEVEEASARGKRRSWNNSNNRDGDEDNKIGSNEDDKSRATLGKDYRDVQAEIEEEDGNESKRGTFLIPPVPKYQPNDKIYAKEREAIYQAVIRRSTFRTFQTNKSTNSNVGSIVNTDSHQSQRHYWDYFVHFQGWNSRHDKWIPEDELMSDNEESRAKAEQSKQKLRAIEKERREKKLKAEREKKERKEKMAAAKKRRLEMDNDTTCNTISLQECCQLPFTLKTILIDDRTKVTRLGWTVANGYDPDHQIYPDPHWTPPRALHILPATITVHKILNQFIKVQTRNLQKQQTHINDDEGNNTKESSDGNVSKANAALNLDDVTEKYQSFAHDMIQLFDIMLPKYLLYTQERTQYLLLMSNDDNKPSATKRDNEEDCTNNNSTCLQDKAEEAPASNSNSSKIVRSNTLSASEIYGGEFLLRMLVRLPTIFTAMESSLELLNSSSSASITSSTYHNSVATTNTDTSAKKSKSSSTLSTSSSTPSQSLNHIITAIRQFHATRQKQQDKHYQLEFTLLELVVFLQKNRNACFKGKYRQPFIEEWTEIERAYSKRCRS